MIFAHLSTYWSRRCVFLGAHVPFGRYTEQAPFAWRPPMNTPPFRTLTISMWAGPGVGKSVTAANLFVTLKKARITCEYVPEYAKELQYQGTLRQTRQLAILAEQHRRLSLVQGHVEIAVTDAPLHISQLYAYEHEKSEVAEFLVTKTQGFSFWNVLLERDLSLYFEQAGRWQPPDAAKAFHDQHVVPFARALPAERLFELHVDEACMVLLEEVRLRREPLAA